MTGYLLQPCHSAPISPFRSHLSVRQLDTDHHSDLLSKREAEPAGPPRLVSLPAVAAAVVKDRATGGDAGGHGDEGGQDAGPRAAMKVYSRWMPTMRLGLQESANNFAAGVWLDFTQAGVFVVCRGESGLAVIGQRLNLTRT